MAKIYDGYSENEPNNEKEIANIPAEVLKKKFLEAYQVIGSIDRTCKHIGMVPRTFYHWRSGDEKFKEEFEKAKANVLTMLEDEAFRRAVHGVQKPVYQGGSCVGFVTEYSDTLLIVLLKANDPQKYKDRFAGELTGADGKPLNPANLKVLHVHTKVPIAMDESQIDLKRDEEAEWTYAPEPKKLENDEKDS